MIPTSKYMGGRFVARRRTRRWFVAFYWGFLVPATGFMVGRTFGRPDGEWLFYPVSVVMVLNLWTFSRFGLKPFGPLPRRPDAQALRLLRGPAETREILADWDFDEREARQRDGVHFTAHKFLVLFSFGWFAVLALCEFLWPAWSRWLGPVFLCLLIAVIVGVPQTLVLWNEPDVEVAREPGMDEQGAREGTR